MEIINQFAQHGVPTLILGFILFFVLKPLVASFTKFIDQHTTTLININDKVNHMDEKFNEMKFDINEIKNKLK